MNTENKILGNQLVVMSRSDLDTMVNEMAQNIVAAQTRNMQNDSEAGIDAPEGMRFITRKETASLLHVNYTTLWRWNKQGYLRSRKVGGRHVMYKYSDVMALLNWLSVIRKEVFMAKDSKTILLFTEQRDAIAYLTDEEAGQMFKAIYDYAEDGVVPKFAGPMMSVFAMIRSQIDRSRDADRPQ